MSHLRLIDSIFILYILSFVEAISLSTFNNSFSKLTISLFKELILSLISLIHTYQIYMYYYDLGTSVKEPPICSISPSKRHYSIFMINFY